MMTMRDIPMGQNARVEGCALPDAMRRRLADLGIIQGANVCCVGQSPLGGIRAYRVMNAIVAIRDADAAGVAVTLREGRRVS